MSTALFQIVERIIQAYENATSLKEEARKALVDTLAVNIAASRVYPKAGKIALQLAGESSGGIPILGTGKYAYSRDAAIANAFLAHSIEFDDWLAPGYIHAGSIIIPLVLSYGVTKDPDEILSIITASYEAALYIGSYFGGSHYSNWHSTATIGSMVAAVTYSLLKDNLQEDILASAISLSATYTGGTWSVNKAKALYKPMSPSFAVQTGILAGSLAIEEREIINEALESTCKLLNGDCKIKDFNMHGIELNGYKFYPACRHSHTSVEAAEELAELVNAKEIRSIEIEVFEHAYNIAGKKAPRTIEEARFSIPYLVSTTLVYGRLTLRTMAAGLHDLIVRKIERKVKLKKIEDKTYDYPSEQPAYLKITTRSGIFTNKVSVPKGDPQRKPSIEDIMTKIRSMRDYLLEEEYEYLSNIARGYGDLNSLLYM